MWDHHRMFTLGGKVSAWVIAMLGMLMLVPALASAADEPCNGSVLLCDRTLDQVVLPGTHNSMSNSEDGWGIPNQLYNIPNQLTMGIRSFLIDTHYGKPGDGGSGIVNSDKAESTGTFLCHELCLLGASPLAAELAKVKDFLAANPREVIVFIVQNGITPDDYATAVTDSGLLDYVYTGSTTTYPTLAQMIDTNQRVVMFSEGNTGSVPWFHNGYAGSVQETPYNFRENEAEEPLTTQQGIDLLTNPATLNSTCRPARGGTNGAMFLMNHWVNGLYDDSKPVTPDPEVSKILNQRDVLVNRARACETRRGKVPNIVAVDIFGEGDLLGAVRELNGIPDPIIPVPTEPDLVVFKPKAATVKAGRKATFAVRLDNIGTGATSSVKVCAKVPAKLARKVSCQVAGVVSAGASKTVKFKVATKKRYRKGSGSVKFTVYSTQPTMTSSAKLTVKPLKKPKKHRKRR